MTQVAQPALTPSPAERILANIAINLLNKKGYRPRDGSMEALFARLRWEWNSGQWVLLHDEQHRMAGWASYYLVTPETLSKIKHGQLVDIFNRADPKDLTEGPCIYVPTGVTTKYATPTSYRDLKRLIIERNPKAKSISSYLVSRHGIRWHTRQINKR